MLCGEYSRWCFGLHFIHARQAVNIRTAAIYILCTVDVLIPIIQLKSNALIQHDNESPAELKFAELYILYFYLAN